MVDNTMAPMMQAAVETRNDMRLELTEFADTKRQALMDEISDIVEDLNGDDGKIAKLEGFLEDELDEQMDLLDDAIEED
jgi:hypothetical protein